MNMAISTIAAKLGMTKFAGSAQAAAASLLEVEGAAKLTQAAMLGPLLKVVAVIALVAAAIAGIAVAIDNASYTAEEKLENAKQSAEEFKTLLEPLEICKTCIHAPDCVRAVMCDELKKCNELTKAVRVRETKRIALMAFKKWQDNRMKQMNNNNKCTCK
jgi:hypothetical protein